MLSSELRNMIVQFVEANFTMSQLEEWLVPQLPFFLRSPDAVDANVVAAIELGLAEVNSTIRTVAEFREQMRLVLRENNVLFTSYPASAAQSTETGSANRTVTPAYAIPGREVFIWVV